MVTLVLPEGLNAEDVVALKMIADERARQRTLKGWSDEHDDGHYDGQLTTAAAVYALDAVFAEGRARELLGLRHGLDFYSPCGHSPATPAENRAKAGALLVAELARGIRQRDRHAAAAGGEG